MKAFEQWLKEEGLGGFPGTDPALINAMHRGWNAAMAERQKPLSDNEMLDWNERALEVAEQQRQPPAKDSLTTERSVTLNGGVTTTDHLERAVAEQPEDGPVAHMMISDDHCQLRLYSVKTEAEAEAKRFNGVIHPLYPESVKAERDALRVDLDRSKARTDRAINEIRALREKVSQLEYSNAVNADAKAQAAKHAEEADRLRERVKELEAHLKRYGSHKSDADGEICEWLKHSERPCTCGLHAAMQEGKS